MLIIIQIYPFPQYPTTYTGRNLLIYFLDNTVHMKSNQRGVLFLVLFVLVVFTIYLSTQYIYEQTRSMKLMGSSTLPIIPLSPALPQQLPSSTREGFTVGFEKRNHAPLPLERRPHVVQQSIPVPPPFPSSAFETVGIDCEHGRCVYREQKESYSPHLYQTQNLPEPRRHVVESTPNYHRTIQNCPISSVPYQQENLPEPHSHRIQATPNYIRTIQNGPISSVPYQQENLPEPRKFRIQAVPNYQRSISIGPMNSVPYHTLF